MANPPPQPAPAQPQLKHVDRVDVSETFVHSLRRLNFDGANLQMEFVVHRIDDPHPPAPLTGTMVTTCRLVMPLPGAIGLLHSLSAIAQGLSDQGIIQPVTQGSRTVN
jgi:hypothetical protein